jgi:hypothetical protein
VVEHLFLINPDSHAQKIISVDYGSGFFSLIKTNDGRFNIFDFDCLHRQIHQASSDSELIASRLLGEIHTSRLIGSKPNETPNLSNNFTTTKELPSFYRQIEEIPINLFA